MNRQAGPEIVASVDIGTNSVKCLVARVDAHGILDTLLDTAVTTRLGEGIHGTGRLGAVPAERTARAVSELASAARRLGAERVRVTGTSALREAANPELLAERIVLDCSLPLEVLTGDDEARLAFVGAVGVTQTPSAVIDLGGGSTELAVGVSGHVTWRHSYRAGAVRFTEAWHLSDPPSRAETQAAIEAAASVFEVAPSFAGYTPVAVGGTVKALAQVALGGRGPVEGFLLTLGELDRQAGLFSSTSVARRREIPGLPPDRADIILAGAIILRCVLVRTGCDSALCTLRGLRHGAVLEMAAAR